MSPKCWLCYKQRNKDVKFRLTKRILFSPQDFQQSLSPHKITHATSTPYILNTPQLLSSNHVFRHIDLARRCIPLPWQRRLIRGTHTRTTQDGQRQDLVLTSLLWQPKQCVERLSLQWSYAANGISDFSASHFVGTDVVTSEMKKNSFVEKIRLYSLFFR